MFTFLFLVSCTDSIQRNSATTVITNTEAVSKTGNQSKILPYPIHQQRLANGLNVVTVPFDSPGTAAFYIVVRVGARNRALGPAQAGQGRDLLRRAERVAAP